jgi:hypothetical protein
LGTMNKIGDRISGYFLVGVLFTIPLCWLITGDDIQGMYMGFALAVVAWEVLNGSAGSKKV